MKTLVIDAIIGAGFPTLTLALTAEQGGLAAFRSAALGPGTHIWQRDKLEALSLPELEVIYEGLRAEREAQAANPPAPAIAAASTLPIGRMH